MSLTNSTPNYVEALRQKNSALVVKTLASLGGVAKFAEIERLSGVKGSLLNHHLARLMKFNVIEKEVKGTYRLKYKTPLCWLFDSKVPYAYFGLLGERKERMEPETATALRLLSKEAIKPSLIYVVTSLEALNQWKSLKLPYNWILCYEDEIVDIDAIKMKVQPYLENLLKTHIVIMDCTSLTKPATIAYYELATSYLIPLIYIYEGKNQLKWLISKEKLRRIIGIYNTIQ